MCIKNSYGVGNQLFNIDLTTESRLPLTIDKTNYSVSCVVESGNTSYFYNTELHLAGEYSVSLEFENVPAVRIIIQPYNSNGELLDNLTLSGWRWVPYYSGYYKEGSVVEIDLATEVSTFKLGFALVSYNNIGELGTIRNIMLNTGSTSKPFEPYSDLKSPQTRLEEILFAICNDTEIPETYYSELEQAYVEAFGGE